MPRRSSMDFIPQWTDLSIFGRDIDVYISSVLIGYSLPLIFYIYFSIIVSMPVLSPPSWLQDLGTIWMYGAYPITGFFISFHLFKNRHISYRFYNYINELTSSIVVFTATIAIILSVTEIRVFSSMSAFEINLAPFAIALLLIILFLSFGVFLSNIYFIYPTIKTLWSHSTSLFKSLFIPPFKNSPANSLPPNQPQIENQGQSLQAAIVGVITPIAIWMFAGFAQEIQQLQKLIEGHMNLLRQLQRIISGNPEQSIVGWLGALEEISTILNPITLSLYLGIIILSLSYAMSWIYLTRSLQEKIRKRFNISYMNMAAITTTLSIPVVFLGLSITRNLIFYAKGVITFALS